MKTEDKQKITMALNHIGKLEFSQNSNDFQAGMSNMAKLILEILANNPNSKAYKYALRDLVERGRNAKITLEKRSQ